VLGEPEEHNWQSGHFWSISVDTEDQWRDIQRWLDRGRMADKVRAIPRLVEGERRGRTLMIRDRGVLTALILKFS
jgi:hypothetical protein